MGRFRDNQDGGAPGGGGGRGGGPPPVISDPPDIDLPDEDPSDDDPVTMPPPRRAGSPVIPEDPDPEYIEYPEYPDFPTPPTSVNRSDYDRRLSFGATLLGGVLGPVYGRRRVNGYCMLKHGIASGFPVMAYAFGVGESVDIDHIRFNEQIPVESGIITRYGKQEFLGTADASNRSSFFSTISGHVEYYPGIVYIAFRPRVEKLNGSLNVIAMIDGKKIHDFRDVAYPGDTTTNHSNPGLVAFDICTDVEMWKALDVTGVNTDQLEDISDWCEEQVNSEDRFHFHGRLDVRDSDQALQEVLRHCHTSYYVYDQTIHFVADMPPRPLTGTWTNSGGGQTFTETGGPGAGAATSEIAVGDVVLIYEGGDHYIYTIATVPDDDTFTVEETPATTHTDQQPRPIADVYLKEEDFVRPPDGSSRDTAEMPDVVSVKYPSEWSNDWQTIRCEDPDGYEVGNPKQTEATLNGCKTASMAARWGHHERRKLSFCPFEWEMVARPAASKLQPGDVFRFNSLDGVTGQLVRLMVKDEDIESGNFELHTREFDMGVYSDDVADEDSTPSDYFTPVAPIVPSAAVHILGETGNWDNDSLIANPDDISGWSVTDGDLALSYDAGNDETNFELTGEHWYPGATDHLSAYLDITSMVEDFGVALISYVVKWKANDNDTVGLLWAYASGADHAAAIAAGGGGWNEAYAITPFANDGVYEYYRVQERIIITADAYHEIQFGMWNTEDPGASKPKIAIKRLRMIAWGEQGQNWPPIGQNHPYRDLGFYERFEWTEGATADDYNIGYDLMRDKGLWGPDVLISSTPRGNLNKTTVWILEHPNQGNQLVWNVNMHGTSEIRRSLFMEAVSVTGHRLEFPNPTQSFEGDTAPSALTYDRTYYEPTTFQTEEPYTWEYFNTFYPDDDTDIVADLWSDYEIELWLDLAGGSSYVLLLAVDWGNTVGFGFSSQYAGEPWFYNLVDQTAYDLATYQIWLKHKYTGKRTQMSLADDIDGDPSPPALVMLPLSGTIERYMDGGFEPWAGNPRFDRSNWDYHYRTGTVFPFVVEQFKNTPGDINKTYQQRELSDGVVLPLASNLVVDSEGATGDDNLIGIHGNHINEKWLRMYPVANVYDPVTGTGLDWMVPQWEWEFGGAYPEADFFVYKGNTATVDGDEPTYTSGIRSLTFDGIDNMLRIKDANFGGFSTTVSKYGGLSFYIRPQTGAIMHLVSQDTDNDILRVDADGSLMVMLDTVAGAQDTGLDLVDNVWQHVSISWVGSVGTYTVKVWLDGVKGTDITGITNLTDSTNDLYFGCDKSRANTFNGDLRVLCTMDSSIDFDLTDEDGNARLQAYHQIISLGGWSPVPTDAKIGLLPAIGEVGLSEDGGGRSHETALGTTLYVRSHDAARTITVVSGDASGNIELIDDRDCVLDDPEKFIVLRYEPIESVEGNWYEVFRSAGEAFHPGTGGEIAGLSAITPDDSDVFVVEDVSASNVKKKATLRATRNFSNGNHFLYIDCKNSSGSDMVARDIVYISGDASGIPNILLADADAAASAGTPMLGCLQQNIANGASGRVQIFGVKAGFTGLTPAAAQYVSTTAGDLTETKPSGSGDIVRVFGHAISATEVFVNPSNAWVEIA